jgi:hypothetical protein
MRPQIWAGKIQHDPIQTYIEILQRNQKRTLAY